MLMEYILLNTLSTIVAGVVVGMILKWINK